MGRVRTRTNSGMGLEGCGVGSRRRWPPWPEKLMRNGNSLAGEGAGPSMEAPRGGRPFPFRRAASEFRSLELESLLASSQRFGHVLEKSLPKDFDKHVNRARLVPGQ